MKFLLCIPAYNEGKIIKETVLKLVQILDSLNGLDWQIVVADNASNDDTSFKVSSINNKKVSVIKIEEKGKGNAVIETAKSFSPEYFGFIDADLSADPKHILSFIDILSVTDNDVVIGSRFKDKSLVNRGVFRTLTSKIFNILQYLILGLDYKDTQCGLKIMNKKGLNSLIKTKEKGWFFDIEFLSICRINNVKIYESAVEWNEFYYPDRKPKLNVILDGLKSVVLLLKIKKRISNEKRSF